MSGSLRVARHERSEMRGLKRIPDVAKLIRATLAEIAPRARKVIAEHLRVQLNDSTDQKRLKDDLKADELDQVEVIMALEEEFAITIADDVADGLTTVGSYIQVIQKGYPRLCGRNTKR